MQAGSIGREALPPPLRRQCVYALEKTVTPTLSPLFAALGGREHNPIPGDGRTSDLFKG